MSIEDIKQIMDSFDPAALLPDLSSIEGLAELVCRFAVLAAPVVLIVLGLVYLLLPPKEANHRFGYRCYFGMGSIEAWRFTQRFAGLVWAVVGGILFLVMLGKTNGLRELAVMDQLWQAGVCILWEIGISLATILAINITIAVLFNSKGQPRFKRKPKERN